jgi:Tol biopolymer transport system component
MWQMTPVGFTEDGSYYFGVNTMRRDVYMASLDSATGDFLTNPAPVPQPTAGSFESVGAFWSPDGRFLAYRLRRATAGFGSGLRVLSVETGETREINLRGLRGMIPYFWSRDGRFILGWGRDIDGRPGFHRVDVLTGETHSFSNFWGVEMNAALGLSTDEQSLFYRAWRDDRGCIWERGLEGGMEELLYQCGGGNTYISAALSPGGEFLAIGEFGAEGGMLLLVPSSGGEPEVLRRFPPGGGGADQIAWTPDGEHIIYRNDREIWSIPRIGGEPRRLEWPIEESMVGALRRIQFSPDGRRIAFDASSGQEELWVMENFLPGR